MKKLLLGISVFLSGILMICAALITAGLVASGENAGEKLILGISSSMTVVPFIVVGSFLALFGLILSLIDVFVNQK